jgi:hypothetical protein
LRNTLVRRLGVFVVGLILARFIPNRTARRFVMFAFVPAIVTFLLDRSRAFRRPGIDAPS